MNYIAGQGKYGNCMVRNEGRERMPAKMSNDIKSFISDSLSKRERKKTV